MDKFALAQQLVALAEELALAEDAPKSASPQQKSASPQQSSSPQQKSASPQQSPAQKSEQQRMAGVKNLITSLQKDMRKILDSQNVWGPKTSEQDRAEITKRIQKVWTDTLQHELVSASARKR